MCQFKPGMRVIRDPSCSWMSGARGTLVSKSAAHEWTVVLDKPELADHNDENWGWNEIYIIPEAIYDSRLYKALNEEPENSGHKGEKNVTESN